MRINNLKLTSKTVLAPLMNFSDQAFRMLCQKFGAGLVFTEKFNINALINDFRKFEKLLEVFPEEHPISVQLIGNDPKIMTKVMDRLGSFKFDGFDLNLGCPSPDSRRDLIGGALLRQPQKISPLLSTMLNATNKAVSAKIRIGYDSVIASKVAKIIEREGADFLTIHGRTVIAEYSGRNNLDVIRSVKEQVDIPVVGNGDVVDGPSAQKLLHKTQCDLVMIGRGAIGNPTIFREVNQHLKGKGSPKLSKSEYLIILQQYHELLKNVYPNEIRNLKFIKQKLERFIRPQFCAKGMKEQILESKSLSSIEKLLFKEEKVKKF